MRNPHLDSAAGHAVEGAQHLGSAVAGAAESVKDAAVGAAVDVKDAAG